jgi:hypothetical protein
LERIHDDLTLLLDEDMHSITLCALHCEKRNTEQIIESFIGPVHIWSLENLNAKLVDLGPKSIKKSFVRIKDCRNKNLEVTKNHIKVASFSGN